MGMPVEPTYVQNTDGFRFRDGVPDPSGVDAAFDASDTAQGGDVTLDCDTLYRLRCRIDQTDTTANVTQNLATEFKPQFKVGTGSWTDFGSEGGDAVAIEYDTPTGFTDGDNTTTSRLGAGAIVTGDGLSVGAATDTITFTTEAASQAEIELSFRINSSQVNDADTIQIRFLWSSLDESPPATTLTETDLPQITVNKPAAAQTMNGAPAAGSAAATTGALNPGPVTMDGSPAAGSAAATTGVLAISQSMDGSPAVGAAAATTGGLALSGTFTTVASGSVLDGANWDLGVPAQGNRVIINHTMTQPGAWSIGDSPAGNTNVLTINNGASLRVDDGQTLNVYGAISIANGALTIGQGSTGGATANVQVGSGITYGIKAGTANNQANCAVVLVGVSGNPATLQKVGAGQCGIVNSSFNGGGAVRSTWGVIDLSDTAGGGSGIRSRGNYSGFQSWYRNTVVKGRGLVWDAGLDAAAYFEIDTSDFAQTAGASIGGGGTGVALTTGTRRIVSSTFNASVTGQFRDFTVGGPGDDWNFFSGQVSMTAHPLAVFEGNVLARGSHTANDTFAATTCQNNIILSTDSTANPHFYSADGSLAAGTYTWSGMILYHEGDDTNGDGFLVPEPTNACTYHIERQLLCRNGADTGPSGTWISALGNSNATFRATHCTGWLKTAAIESGFAIAETYSGHANMATYLKNSLGLADDNSAPLVSSGGTPATGYVTSANYNQYWNVDEDTALTDAYGPADSVFGSTPGANDVSANPDCVAPKRNPKTWDTANGGPGTTANAVTEMQKRTGINYGTFDTDYSSPLLWAHIREGFRPTDATGANAADDSGTIGAVPYDHTMAGSPAAGSAAATTGGLSTTAAAQTMDGAPGAGSAAATTGALQPGGVTQAGSPAVGASAATTGALQAGGVTMDGSPAAGSSAATTGALTISVSMDGVPAVGSPAATTGALQPGPVTMDGVPAPGSEAATTGALQPGPVSMAGNPAVGSEAATTGALQAGNVTMDGSPGAGSSAATTGALQAGGVTMDGAPATGSAAATTGALSLASGPQTMDGVPCVGSPAATAGALVAGGVTMSGASAAGDAAATTGALNATHQLSGAPAVGSPAATTGALSVTVIMSGNPAVGSPAAPVGGIVPGGVSMAGIAAVGNAAATTGVLQLTASEEPKLIFRLDADNTSTTQDAPRRTMSDGAPGRTLDIRRRDISE